MEKIILKLLGVIWYLVKVYMITAATIIFVVTIYGVIYKNMHYNPSNQTIYSHPFVIAIMLAYALPKFNLLTYIILLFHRFNIIEIICESLSFAIIVCWDIIPPMPYVVLLMAVLMFLYFLIKKLGT